MISGYNDKYSRFMDFITLLIPTFNHTTYQLTSSQCSQKRIQRYQFISLGTTHSFVHSVIYYAFIKSIPGLAPFGYRTCHRIIQKYNTNINITVISKHLSLWQSCIYSMRVKIWGINYNKTTKKHIYKVQTYHVRRNTLCTI